MTTSHVIYHFKLSLICHDVTIPKFLNKQQQTNDVAAFDSKTIEEKNSITSKESRDRLKCDNVITREEKNCLPKIVGSFTPRD